MEPCGDICTTCMGASDAGVANGKAARRATVCVGVTCGDKIASETAGVLMAWADDELVKVAPTFPPIAVGS